MSLITCYTAFVSRSSKGCIKAALGLTVAAVLPVYGQTNTFPADGNVGVGTTSPAAKLVVQGTSAEAWVQGDSTRTLALGNWDGTWQYVKSINVGAALTPLQLQASVFSLTGGNVGVGTTTPSYKLDVDGNIHATAGIISSSTGLAGLFSGYGGGLDGSIYQQFDIYADASNGLTFEAPKDAGGNRLNIQFNWRGGGTSPLFIQGSTSNIGIGTNAPVTLLQLSATNTVSPAITLNTSNTGTANGFIKWTNQSGAGQAFIGSNFNVADGAGNLEFGTGGTATKLTITSAGNVGIGTTTPAAKLDVAGGVNVRGAFTTWSGGTSYYGIGQVDAPTLSPSDLDITRSNLGGNSILRINYHTGVSLSAHSAYGGIRFYNQGYSNSNLNPYDSTIGATMVMAVTNGAVGIGTTNPVAPLHVFSSNEPQVRLQSSNRTWSILSNTAWGNNGFSIYDITADCSRLQIDAAGNVGINTITPQAKLDVAGSANVSGNLTVGGTFAAAGYTASNGVVTGGSTGLALAAGGVNQNVTISPSGSGNTIISGNVGLGTTAPRDTLEVKSAGTGGATFVASTNANNIFSGGHAAAFYSTAMTGGLGISVGSNNTSLIQSFKTSSLNGIGATSEDGVLLLNPSGGNVGIGMTNPTQGRLQVQGIGTGTLGIVATFGDSSTNQNALALRAGTGRVDVLGTYLGTAINTDLTFTPTKSDGTQIEAVRIQANSGNVGIGVADPGTYKLAVNGTIHAKEVVVDQIGWADYVFDENYRNAPLSEVEQHIKEHKHLPGVPSAQEVAEKGVGVGQMQTVLLQKIEELTLHMIRMEKENAELRQRVQQLESSTQ